MESGDSEPRLTRELIATSRVIARGRGIRDLARLIRRYGGEPRGWVKKSTRPFVRNDRPWEYHWYEHHGIGRVEAKLIDLRSRDTR